MYKSWEKKLKDINFEVYKISPKQKCRYAGELMCDTIITFDIETTSLYLDAAGKPHVYTTADAEQLRKGKPNDVRRAAIMYHWQLSVSGYHFTGRTWTDLKRFFKDLHRRCPARKFIYVHNLSFEFGWLPNVISFSEDDDIVLARESHRVMSAYTAEINAEFRCSYYLTQKSLATWGSVIGMEKSKDLDYNVLRTPRTELNEAEIRYCFIDVDIVHKGIENFKQKYRHLYNIPLTQTGEVRRKLRKVFKKEFDFYNLCRKLQPRSLAAMKWMLSAFMGGCVLVNPTFKDEKLTGPFIFRDISSSYPWALISERYPLAPFKKVKRAALFDEYMSDPDLTYIVDFTAENVRTKVPCLFLSSSKVDAAVDLKTMNGRIATAGSFHAILSEPDFKLFKKCYHADIRINFIKISRLEYLPDGFRKFIIRMYAEKTRHKHDEDPELYQNAKQMINALFGINCQKLLTDTICFDADRELEDGTAAPWYVDELTKENFGEALWKVLYNEDGSPKKLYTAPQIGIFCSAYARSNLWAGILGEVDHEFQNVDDVIYTDTDSVKMLYSEEAAQFFEDYNAGIMMQHEIIAEQLEIDPAELSPTDDEGTAYPIGIFSEDGSDAQEFKSLGAKKYCCRNGKGKLKITVAGVPKEGVLCLDDDIDNFTDGFIFRASRMEQLGVKSKLTPVYIAEQRPIRFPDGYRSDDRFAVCMIPIDYKLSKSYDMYADTDTFFRVLWGNRTHTRLLG